MRATVEPSKALFTFTDLTRTFCFRIHTSLYSTLINFREIRTLHGEADQVNKVTVAKELKLPHKQKRLFWTNGHDTDV